MKNYKQKYYNLFQLFGGYFHQDWKEDYDWKGKEPNFEDVIRRYKTEDSFEGIQKTESALNDLLSLKLSENELREVITKDFISSYTGRGRGLTTKKFIEKILEVLKESKETEPLKRIV